MGPEDVAVIRERVQTAQSGARLAQDPTARADWEEIAAAWMAVLKAAEEEIARAAGNAPPRELHEVHTRKK